MATETTTTLPTFTVPFVTNNPGSWGPPYLMGGGSRSRVNDDVDDGNNPDGASSSLSKFVDLPYSPFGRSDRLGRAADFTNISRGDRSRFNRRSGGGPHGDRDRKDGGGTTGHHQNSTNNTGYTNRGINNDNDDGDDGDESFQLVDTSKTVTTKRFVTPAARRRQHTARLRQVNARRQQQSTTALSKEILRSGGGGGGPGGGRGGPGGGRMVGGGRGGRGGRGPGGRGFGSNRVDRQPSVAVQPDWVKVEELDLAKLTKNLQSSTDIPPPEDVLWCGFLDPYNESYDMITPRQQHPLKRMDTKEFYPVTTTDDPVLEKLAVDGIGKGEKKVFVTDTILAHLMTCTRSVYPWDLVIQKVAGGILFLDKRDNSQLDFLTVSETAYNPPSPAEEGINNPERLGLEATMINQNFSQQILKKTGRKEMDLPNPFFDEDDADGMEPASVAFRYRKFELDAHTTLVCRTELHGLVKKTQYMTAFALNEYTPTVSQGGGPSASQSSQSWREKIDSQRGAVLANELKNNSFKLAKWTAQSLLAGADQMKIGFCSRVTPKNAYEHVILATQFYRPKDFASQITLNEGQMWAMLRMFVQLFHKQEVGKYVLMREPNKAMLTLYRVPPGTFDDEE